MYMVAPDLGKPEKGRGFNKRCSRSGNVKENMKNRRNPGKIVEPEITTVEINFGYLPYTSTVSSHNSLSPSKNFIVF